MSSGAGAAPIEDGSETLTVPASFFYISNAAVCCTQVCMAHAPKTGGMMELGELRQKLIKSRGKSALNQVIIIASECVSDPDPNQFDRPGPELITLILIRPLLCIAN